MKISILCAGAALAFASATIPSAATAQSGSHVLRGAGVGAAGGAIVGAVVPGVSVGKGALIGAAGGALYNATVNKNGHRYKKRHRRYRHR